MKREIAALTAFLGLITVPASTQTVKDVHSVLEASLKAMGGVNLKTIQYSGSGWSSRIGQTYGLAEDWPHYEVAGYTRAIDYDAKWSREDYTRRQGKYPLLGRPPMLDEKVTTILSGNYAWDMRGDQPAPLTNLYLDGVSYADLRQPELAITPHGFLKAALAAKDATAITQPIVGASDAGLSQNGRKVTIVSFTLGKYRVNGTINDQNLVELTDTWFPNPVYGDMDYEMRFTKYKNFDGVMFPTLLHVHQGDPRLNPAHNYYEYTVTDVKANVPVTTMPVPDVVRMATAAPVKVESQKLGDGVWLLAGGTHHSVLVEFKDFAAVVEAPQNEARSLAVIEEANRLLPNKLIKYVVNTHHHFDHAGGLRTYLSQGTTVITHESNKQYYLDIMFYPSPRELQPDRMALFSPMYMISRRPAPIQTVSSQLGGPGGGADRYAITDGERILEIFHVQDMAYELEDPSYAQGNTSADMLMVYLPKEKILINADLYSPPAPGAPLPAPTAAMRTLYQNMRKQKLDVAQHVPIHGRIGSNEEFLKIVGQASAPALAQLKVITSGGFAAAFEELRPAFEKTSGITVTATRGQSQGTGPNTIGAQLRRGVGADVVIMAREGLDELIADGKIVAKSDVDLAQTPLGMSVRAGAAKPDIGSVDAFKQTLLRAKSITFPNSTTGIYMTAKMFPQLGIASAIAGKITNTGVAAVASGESELAIQPVSELLHAPGVEFIGTLPAQIQYVSVFSAAIVADSKEPGPAKRLIAFLVSEEAKTAIKNNGMDAPRSR